MVFSDCVTKPLKQKKIIFTIQFIYAKILLLAFCSFLDCTCTMVLRFTFTANEVWEWRGIETSGL